VALGRLSFSGPDPTAALFALEVDSSFGTVLAHDYFANTKTIHTGPTGAGWLGLEPSSGTGRQTTTVVSCWRWVVITAATVVMMRASIVTLATTSSCKKKQKKKKKHENLHEEN
jgi:hypothetical protein